MPRGGGRIVGVDDPVDPLYVDLIIQSWRQRQKTKTKEVMLLEGVIFNIMKYSIHDGPGIRTTVFFKGCPLSCSWCHNPEGRKTSLQVVRFPNKCIGCGKCVRVCPTNAIYMEKGEIKFDINKCNQCGECTKLCYAAAMEIVGKAVTVNEVMKEIEKDYVFYEESGGGVTFSGGEPFAQPEFLKELLKSCKNKGIHTAVDTCGYVKEDILLDNAPLIDLFLYDIKIMDDKEHIKYTGVSNKIILENLKALTELDKRIFIRIPIIPGISDSDKNIDEISKFLLPLRNIEQINILPYHNIATEKYKRLGKEYSLEAVEIPSDEKMANIQRKLESQGFKVKIGG